MTRHQMFVWLALSLLSSGVAALNLFPGAAARFSDALFSEKTPPSRITIFKIDDASLGTLGQWPFPRATFADIFEKLHRARVIGIDIQFRENSRLGEEDDEALEEALRRLKTPVVFPAEMDALGNPILSLPLFRDLVSFGFSNIRAEYGGIVRAISSGSPQFPSFSYVISTIYKGAPPFAGEGESLRIQFHGANNTYPSFSISDLISGKVPEEFIRDRIALIGVTASDVRNFYLTPFGFMSGIEIQANAIDTLIEDIRYIENAWITVLSIFLLSLLAVFASVHIRNFFLLVFTLLGIALLYVLGAFAAFEQFFVLDLFYPLLSLVGVALLFNTSEYVTVTRREALLRDSFSHLNALVESMHEGIIVVDTESRIVVSNPAAQRIFNGRFMAEGDGVREISRLLGDMLSLESRVRKSIQEEKISIENEILIGDKFYQLFVAPIKHEGSILGSAIIFHDITPQKEIERIREDFTSMMVHELRSPVDAMKKIAEAILEKKVTPRKKALYRRYIELIHDNSAEILTLVGDLLDAAKIEAGKFEITKTPVDVRALISDRVRFFKEKAGAACITLSFHGDASVSKKVSCDERRVAQVLNNLISNALKFTPSGGTVVVHATLCKKGSSLQEELKSCKVPYADSGSNLKEPLKTSLIVAVSDTGSGISSKDQATLFNKFKQLENSKRAKESHGTGLGLVIVKGIVEAHGGVAGVFSEVGKGSTFYFTLPV